MRFFFDVLRLEARLQWRSLRFRLGTGLFVAATCAPPLLVAIFISPQAQHYFGAGTYLSWSLDVARFAVVVLATIVAGNRSSALGQERMWPVLSAAGVSNIGFLWRRWGAMSLLLSGLALFPVMVAAGVAAVLGLPPLDPMTYAGSWLLLLAAAAAVQAALWLALVTLTGSELGAALLYVFGTQLANLLTFEVALGLFGSTFRLHDEWVGLHRLQTSLYYLGKLGEGGGGQWSRGFQLATDGAFDWRLAWDWWWPRATPHLAVAVLLLAVSSALLRRTRSDLRPLQVGPDHPLRNLMRYVHGFRHRYTPDAALRFEKLWMVLGVAAVVTAVAAHAARQRDYETLAKERYAIEGDTAGQWTTPLGVAPRSRRLEGELRSDGTVRVTTHVVIENRGHAPAERTAWRLDPFVGLDARAEGHRLSVHRLWDRLFVTLDPPLAPGASAALEFIVDGRPREPYFNLNRGGHFGQPFSLAYRNYLRGVARFGDIALSGNMPLLSGRGLDLEAYRVSPVPRYTTWELTPPPDLQGENGLEVPEEAVEPVEELEIELTVPGGLFVADVCGHSTASSAPRLVGSCRSSMLDYRLRGGRLDVVEASESMVLAAMPNHVEKARRQVPVIEQVVALSQHAWPSLAGLDSLVAIEWPPAFRLDDGRSGMLHYDEALGGWMGERPESFGNLVSIPEGKMVSRRPMEVEELVSDLLVARLLKRRDVEFLESRVIKNLLATAMAHRMGMAPATGATVTGERWHKFWAGQPISGKRRRNFYVTETKVPALTMDLIGRAGAEHFYAAVDAFLTSPSEEPGTLEELLDLLEGFGVDLDSWRVDHTGEEEALPELRLENVSSAVAGGGFVVRGELANVGTGRARCPIVVKAEGQTRRLEVNVGPKAQTPFELSLARRPFTVVLDPEKTCFRWVTRGSELVERIVLGEAE